YDPRIKQGLGLTTQEDIIGYIYIGTPAAPAKPLPELNPSEFMQNWCFTSNKSSAPRIKTGRQMPAGFYCDGTVLQRNRQRRRSATEHGLDRRGIDTPTLQRILHAVVHRALRLRHIRLGAAEARCRCVLPGATEFDVGLAGGDVRVMR